MKTEIELQASQVVPDWVNRFYELTVNDKPLDKVYTRKLNYCDVCYTGDFRSRVGLSRNYFKEKHKEYCSTCVILSNIFLTIKNDEFDRRTRYLEVLDNLFIHMRWDHNVAN